MRTRGKFSARRIAPRRRMWAAVAALFSVTWSVVSTTDTYSQAQCLRATSGTSVKTLIGPGRWSSAPAGHVHLRHAPALIVPVGYTPSDVSDVRYNAMPVEPDSVYSHRQMDEFLDHQARLSAGGRDVWSNSDDIQVF